MPSFKNIANHKKTKWNIGILTALVLLGLFVLYEDGASPQDLPLRTLEEAIGTDGKLNWSFHQVLEDKERNGFRFPGYLIGVEETSRKNLGLDYEHDVFDVEGLKSSPISMFRSMADSSDRLFVSHILKYSNEPSQSRIKSEIQYSVYENSQQTTTTVPLGHQALLDLKNVMEVDLKENVYTHIIIISMGWNTSQIEAIGDFNSLVGQLVEKKEESGDTQRFNPLVVGVTWPSKSHMVSGNYPAAAYDADELGLIWISYLLNEVILPLKKDHDTKVVLLGHSLGARALTMGLFAARWKAEDTAMKNVDVDLVFGYQPSFSINRFIPNMGMEGSPYASFKETNAKFVFTWSQHDVALNFGKLYMTAHMGGSQSSQVAQSYPKLFTSLSVSDPDIQNSLRNDSNILHLDASELLKYKTYENAGGAHSDIFRPAAAQLLWEVIKSVGDNPEKEMLP